MEIPRNYNPADFYIEKLAIYPKKREENLAQIEVISTFWLNSIKLISNRFQYICNAYEKSPQNSRYKSEIISLHSSYERDEEEDNFFSRFISRFSSKEEDDPSGDVQKKKKSRYATNSWTQFRWLIWRNFINTLKNPFEIRLQIGLALVSLNIYIYSLFCLFLCRFNIQFLGVVLGLLYLRLPYDQTAIQNFNSVMFLIIINTTFGNIFAVVQVKLSILIEVKRFKTKFFRVIPRNTQSSIKIMTMLFIVFLLIILLNSSLRQRNK